MTRESPLQRSNILRYSSRLAELVGGDAHMLAEHFAEVVIGMKAGLYGDFHDLLLGGVQ